MAYTYKYPRPAVTADCIVITKEAEPKVLLIERGDERPELAFDHEEIIRDAIKKYKDVVR